MSKKIHSLSKLGLGKRSHNSELELQKQLNEAVITYAGMIAHDQRTPIAKIMMITEFCQRFSDQFAEVYQEAKAKKLKKASLLNDKDMDYFKKSVAELKSCYQSMNNITDNSLKNINLVLKMHNGYAKKLEFVKCNIKDNLANDKLLVPFKPSESKLLHCEIRHRFEYLGNSISIDQIISNLLSNALYQIRKYGQGEIFIRSEDCAEVNKLYIKDTAGNVNLSMISQMFGKPFTTKTTGSGLGLTFCKKIMQLFDGDITANLVDNEFIEFSLTFPKIHTRLIS